MNDIIKNIEAAQLKEVAPEFHVGDTVKVYGKIKEGNRERVQIFEGTVLKRQGGGAREAAENYRRPIPAWAKNWKLLPGLTAEQVGNPFLRVA